jgi:hypothetical protein
MALAVLLSTVRRLPARDACLTRPRRIHNRTPTNWTRRPIKQPRLAAVIRKLIREMSIANPLWGAPRIDGELLKLGVDIGQTSVAKYMARRRAPHPKAGGRSFAIMPTASLRWICSSYRQSHFICSTAC